MTIDIPKPDISPNFTIDDIHKIREWHHEKQKGMTTAEIVEDIHKGASEFEALLAQPRNPAIKEKARQRVEEALTVSRTTDTVNILTSICS